MKTAKELVSEWSFYGMIRTLELEAIVEQAKKEAWNEALDWSSEHALLKIESKEIPSIHITQCHGYIDDGNEMCITVSKESILKGKI